MKLHRIWAFGLRHLYPLKRDFDLLSDMIYWPIIDIMLWGITSMWLVDASGIQGIVVAILTGLILWNVIWRAQAEISRNLMDEIWNNNLVNLFSTPLQLKEWVTGVLLLSITKTLVTLLILIPVVLLMYSINIFQIGLWLIVFMSMAMVTGWWVGFISSGIVLRYGPKVQTVIWTLPAILLPFSAVFFPLDQLPQFLQYISLSIPTTYIFESMRSILQDGTFPIQNIFISFALNAVFITASLWYFVRSFHHSQNLGLGRFD